MKSNHESHEKMEFYALYDVFSFFNFFFKKREQEKQADYATWEF